MLSADGSVGSPHVRVGHRQDLYSRKPHPETGAAFFCAVLTGLPGVVDFRQGLAVDSRDGRCDVFLVTVS